MNTALLGHYLSLKPSRTPNHTGPQRFRKKATVVYGVYFERLCVQLYTYASNQQKIIILWA